MLRTLDLFSGIGGFSLGLERAGGFETVAFCEIDPFCRKVLAKHWPKVPCYEDVRFLTADTLRRDGVGRIDAVCGGFPCQDISTAGKRAGIKGGRSGLWSEYRRLIGDVRPKFVIVENVSSLLGLGLGDVLRDLSEIGYDAIWDCVPASAIGAPHQRDRVWIVGHPAIMQCNGGNLHSAGHSEGIKAHQNISEPEDSRSTVANPYCERLPLSWPKQNGKNGRHTGRAVTTDSWWSVEPDVGRVAHGVPSRVDRLRSLGNAVVPQIPEMIGRAILAAEMEPAHG